MITERNQLKQISQNQQRQQAAGSKHARRTNRIAACASGGRCPWRIFPGRLTSKSKRGPSDTAICANRCRSTDSALAASCSYSMFAKFFLFHFVIFTIVTCLFTVATSGEEDERQNTRRRLFLLHLDRFFICIEFEYRDLIYSLSSCSVLFDKHSPREFLDAAGLFVRQCARRLLVLFEHLAVLVFVCSQLLRRSLISR